MLVKFSKSFKNLWGCTKNNSHKFNRSRILRFRSAYQIHRLFDGVSLIVVFLSFQSVFSVTPLNGEEWFTVMKMSIPVVLLDEVLKFVARKYIDGTKESNSGQSVIIAWVIYFAFMWYFGI